MQKTLLTLVTNQILKRFNLISLLLYFAVQNAQ